MARNAMATRFEIVLAGHDISRMRAAGEEALDEIQRIEGRLSLYRPESEIAQINRSASSEPVRVSPEVLNLLLRAREVSELSGGTFDPTIAPLVRCWGFMKGSGSRPADKAIASALELIGFKSVELNQSERTVRFARPGMMLDLGSIGKGYALDCAAEILRDAGMENAFLHGGTSTIVAFGSEPGTQGWRVAIENPHSQTDADPLLATVNLTNESLSVSAVKGKSFEMDGKVFGHVIDPRTGRPAENAFLGAVIVRTATFSDALSTVVLLGSESDLARLPRKVREIRYLQFRISPVTSVHARGIEIHKSLDIPRVPSV